MYKLKGALCLARSIGAQWKSQDLSNILVFDIYNNYAEVFLTLSTPYLDGDLYVNMKSLQAEFAAYNDTLTNLLDALGNRALTTVDALPNAKVRYAKYSDAFYSGYKVDTTLIGVGSTTNYPPEDLVDLKITRPNYETDLSLIHSHCLVSVNGYFHRTDTDGTHAFVYQGRKSLQKSKQNQLGIFSFLDIGAVTQVPITPEDIYASDESADLKSRAYIYMNQDLTNKTVLLVLGGYLVMPEDGVFWQVGEKTFALNFSALPMLERYFESSLYLDLSDLGLSHNTENPDEISATEFFSDTVLKKYLTLSQSFFVIVDTPAIFSQKLFLKACNMPGMFTAYEDPVYPLFVGYGKVAEYWKTYEDGYWAVNVQDSFYRNFVFSSRPTNELKNVTPNALPSKTFRHSPGCLLQIGTYK